MKMNLKNRNLRRLKLIRFNFNSKNLFIFLLSFLVVSFIVGVCFYFFLNTSDKELFTKNILNLFSISDNYNYFSLLKDSILKNVFSLFLVWILGISVIGVLFVLFIYFFHIFSMGFTVASLFGEFGLKGVIASFCYLFPSKICYLVVLFLVCLFSIKLSYKIIKLCFTKEEVNIKNDMRRYFNILLVSFFIVVAISLMEVFIDPFFIKLFTYV